MKRLLAVAAVVLLTMPAMASAAEHFTEQNVEVVEGHTVFVALTHYPTNETLNRTVEEAAAAAIYVSEDQREVRREDRFGGVLWFNDQFLVNPSNSASNDRQRAPCGGAVIAWNADAAIDETAFREGAETTAPVVDPANGDFNVEAFLTDELYHNGSSSAPTNVVTVSQTSFEYLESYLITDPNDNTWIIDKYDYTFGTETEPIWVVNILGDPTFSPQRMNDDGRTFASSCSAYTDDPWGQRDIYGNWQRVDGASGNGVSDTGAKPPSIGYYEPTNPDEHGGASYCYPGQVNPDGREHGTGCPDQEPRKYNAVLFFFLGPDDVRTVGTKNHGPGVADDNNAGNSHPYNPKGIHMGTDANGDDTWFDVHAANRQCRTLECDGGDAHTHNTGNVDILYSPTWRPVEPIDRNFEVMDYRGSTQAFDKHE